MKQETDRKVLELLAQEHVLSAGDAAERLGVSGASIRRSFRRLAELGEVRRVHGGIEELNRGMDPAYPFFLRMQWFTREKEALARRAISLLQGCRTIFVDGGTTTAHLGMLLRDPRLRIITNSLALNDVLSRNCGGEAGPEVILTGGHVNRKSAILIGPESVETIGRFHADATVISGSAIDENGIYDNMEEAAFLQRKMIENSDRLIIVADASKFGRRAPSRIVPAEKLSLVVTNFVSDNYRQRSPLRVCPPGPPLKTPATAGCSPHSFRSGIFFKKLLIVFEYFVFRCIFTADVIEWRSFIMVLNSDLMRGVAEPVILRLLAERMMYGYEIIRQVNERTNGEFQWKEGTLYPCLHRLEEQGLIQSRWELAGSRPRRYYAITRRGIAAMQEKVEEARRFAGALNLLLGAI